MKNIKLLQGMYNAIMHPVFWQDRNGAEYFVDDFNTGKYYIIRSTDGDKFFRVPGGKTYRNYISAYAALYVWAKAKNMLAIDIFKGGENHGRKKKVSGACHVIG